MIQITSGGYRSTYRHAVYTRTEIVRLNCYTERECDKYICMPCILHNLLINIFNYNLWNISAIDFSQIGYTSTIPEYEYPIQAIYWYGIAEPRYVPHPVIVLQNTAQYIGYMRYTLHPYSFHSWLQSNQMMARLM